MRRLTPEVILFTVMLVLGQSLVACDTSKANARIGQFALATQELKRGVQSSFDQTEKANERVHFSRASRIVQRAVGLPSDTPEAKQARSLAVRAAIGAISPQGISPLFSQDDLEARLSILDGLAAYSTKLSSIMSNESLEQIDQRTKALGDSLVALGQNNVLASKFPRVAGSLQNGETMAILETASTALGRWLLDGYRHREVPKAIREMKPHINRLCELLERDIGVRPAANGQGGNGLHLALFNAYVAEFNDHALWLEAATKSTPGLSPLETRDEIHRSTEIWDDYRETSRLLDATAESIEAFQAAHQKLDESFVTRVTDLDVLIEILKQEVSRLQDYHAAAKK